ncbi:MAG: PEGA domain-containing protein [Kofleriaceae bacterium]
MRLVTLAALVGLGALGATAAADQPADPVAAAKAEATAAAKLASAGDLAGAAAGYRRAYALDPRPEYQCNVGVAYYKAQQLPRAQFFLTQCVLGGTSLDPSFLASVRSVQTAVEAKLREGEFTPVGVVVEPAGATVTIDAWEDDEGFVGARALWLPWGTHTLTVSAEGYVTRTETVPLATRARVDVRVELERQPVVEAPPVDPPPIDAPPVDAPPVDAPPVDAPPVDAPPAPRRTAAIVATSVTATLAVGAGAAYLLARHRASQASEYFVDEPEFATYRDKARAWQKVAIGTGIVAAVGAGVSAYLWLRRPPGERRVTVGGDLGAGGASAWVTLDF